MKPNARQLALLFSGWGGKRKGAGRRPKSAGLRNTPHRARPQHWEREPVHVTMRARLSCLRAQSVFRRIKVVLGIATRLNEDEFRIVEYSVQSNHIHMLIEGRDKQSLSANMRGLAVRLARAINKVLRRNGSVWADRWHGHPLGNPRSVRNALCYVLLNEAKHARRQTGIDPCSSAQWFNGFELVVPTTESRVTSHARSWLLGVGWRKWGLLDWYSGR